MNAWGEAIEASTFDFVEELERRGFRANGRTLSGTVGVDADTFCVDLTLPDGFPFLPPRVFPPHDFPRSWHRERDGAMCLYPKDGRDQLPWLNVAEFLALVLRWGNESKCGWPGDFPDLDLERYFEQTAEALVVYGDLDELNNRFVQLRHLSHVTRVMGAGSIPKKKRLAKSRAFGYVTDIGEPDVPPMNWEDLKTAIPADDAALIQKAVADGRFSFLIVRYARGGASAAVVLKIWKTRSGALDLASVRSASEAPATLTLRAGVNAMALSGTRVAVVGVGAIGSFVCDLLARAGVGTITAYDPDTVSPGNLIRHLAGQDSIGLPKPEAVKHIIERRNYTSTAVVSVAAGTPTPQKVMALFADNDLVIDASASGDATHLLASAASVSGNRLLSVCLQEEGSVVRVDVVPPLAGDAIPPTKLGPPPALENLLFEAGCGDPISQTPAFAVYEAAALVVRHAVGLLIGSPVADAGTIRDYR